MRVVVQSFENIPDPLIPYTFHKLVLSSVAPDLITSEHANWRPHFNVHLQNFPRPGLRFESIENLLTDMASVSIVGCPSPLLNTRQGRQRQQVPHVPAGRSQSSSRYNVRLETAFVGPNNETYTTFKFEEAKPQK